MRKYKTVWLLILLICSFISCDERNADENDPMGSTVAPKQVTDVTVENFEGGAIIRYKLPDDLNMKYLRASYTLQGSTEYNVNVSYYVDSVVVDGFPEAKEYEVKLYSVSHGETASEPVLVTVKPNTPVYKIIGESIKPHLYFGGLRVEFEGNDRNNPVSMGFLKKQDGIWRQVDTHYTTSKQGDFYLFNQESVESDFGIFVMDRWGNISDTTYISGSPWYEEECNKNLFRHLALPTDTYICHTWGGASVGNHITALWNGLTDQYPMFQSKIGSKLPQWFTIDLGEEYNLSRVVLHPKFFAPQDYSYLFKNGHIKTFELWGSTDPNTDGSWDDSWYKLGDFESVKPSGNPANVAANDEDKAIVKTGEIFLFPADIPVTRYVRLKSVSVWGTVDYVYLNEVTFYGSKADKK